MGKVAAALSFEAQMAFALTVGHSSLQEAVLEPARSSAAS